MRTGSLTSRRAPGPEAAPSGAAGSAPPVRRGLFARLGSALAVVAVSLIVPLLVLEAGLRLFAPQTTAVNVSEWDPSYGWRNRPGARGFFRTPEFNMQVRINSLGLRGDETTVDKPPGTFRLLGLGDSFAFGHGVAVESCFVSVAGRTLDERSRAARGPRVEFLNAGVGKWGTAAELLYLEREGLMFAPDAVVLAFCVDNDFENNADGNVLRLVEDRLVPVENPEPTMRKAQSVTRRIPGYEFLAQNSHLVNFLRVRASVLEARGIQARARPTAAGDSAAADSATAPGPNWEQRRLPVTLMLMDSLAVRTRAAGTGLLVLFVPSRWQTVPEARWGGRMFQDPRPHAAMVEQVIAHLDSLGVPVVYPVRELSEAGRERELYFEEQHLNDAGSRIVAEALVEGLAAAGLVPGARAAADSLPATSK
ncbi:MAG: SGNH/GDSL hydrolase family protein [Candidatus Eisenbacteria bacterium]